MTTPSGPFTPAAAANVPWGPADQNLVSWNFDPAPQGQAVLLPAAGTLAVMAVKLLAPAVITNLIINIGTVGVTLTAGQCFGCLYAGAGGALIGQTADQSGPWTSLGLKVMALAGGPFTVQPGILYAGLWWNGTTAPKLKTGDNSAVVNAGLAAAASRFGTANTGLTTTAPGNLGVIAAATTAFWCGLS